jgi:hypothetical protein
VKDKRQFSWLDKRIEDFGFFGGSLLKYVGSSGSITHPVTKLGTDSMFVKLDSNENFHKPQRRREYLPKS